MSDDETRDSMLIYDIRKHDGDPPGAPPQSIPTLSFPSHSAYADYADYAPHTGQAYNPAQNNPASDLSFEPTILPLDYQNPLGYLQSEPRAALYTHSPEVLLNNYDIRMFAFSLVFYEVLNAHFSHFGHLLTAYIHTLATEALAVTEAMEAAALHFLESLVSVDGAALTVRSLTTFRLKDQPWISYTDSAIASLYSARLFTVLNALHANVSCNARGTKRGLYYFAPTLHEAQSLTDRHLMTWAATLGFDHHLLGVRAAPKAFFAGEGVNVVNERGTRINSHDGEQVLPNLYFTKSIEVLPVVNWVTFVEKYDFFLSIFQAAGEFERGHPDVGRGLIISLGGMSDFSSRIFAEKIDELLPLINPMISLVDLDAPGVRIAAVLANGSPGEQQPKCINRLVCLGLFREDRKTYGMVPRAEIQMTTEEAKEAADMLEYPGVKGDPFLQKMVSSLTKYGKQISLSALPPAKRAEFLYDKLLFAKQLRRESANSVTPRKRVHEQKVLEPLYKSTADLPTFSVADAPVLKPDILDQREQHREIIDSIRVGIEQVSETLTRRGIPKLVEKVAQVMKILESWADPIAPFLAARGIENKVAGMLYLRTASRSLEVVTLRSPQYAAAIKSVLDTYPDGCASEDDIVQGVIAAYPEFVSPRHNIHKARIRALLDLNGSPFVLARQEDGKRIYRVGVAVPRYLYRDPVMAIFRSHPESLTIKEIKRHLRKDHPSLVRRIHPATLRNRLAAVLKQRPFRALPRPHHCKSGAVRFVMDDAGVAANAQSKAFDLDGLDDLDAINIHDLDGTDEIDDTDDESDKDDMDSRPGEEKPGASASAPSRGIYHEPVHAVYDARPGVPMSSLMVIDEIAKRWPQFIEYKRRATMIVGVNTILRQAPFQLVHTPNQQKISGGQCNYYVRGTTSAASVDVDSEAGAQPDFDGTNDIIDIDDDTRGEGQMEIVSSSSNHTSPENAAGTQPALSDPPMSGMYWGAVEDHFNSHRGPQSIRMIIAGLEESNPELVHAKLEDGKRDTCGILRVLKHSLFRKVPAPAGSKVPGRPPAYYVMGPDPIIDVDAVDVDAVIDVDDVIDVDAVVDVDAVETVETVIDVDAVIDIDTDDDDVDTVVDVDTDDDDIDTEITNINAKAGRSLGPTRGRKLGSSTAKDPGGIYRAPVIAAFLSRLNDSMSVHELSGVIRVSNPSFADGKSVRTLRSGIQKVVKSSEFHAITSENHPRYRMNSELWPTQPTASTASTASTANTEADAGIAPVLDLVDVAYRGTYLRLVKAAFDALPEVALSISMIMDYIRQSHASSIGFKSDEALWAGIHAALDDEQFECVCKKGQAYYYTMAAVQASDERPASPTNVPSFSIYHDSVMSAFHSRPEEYLRASDILDYVYKNNPSITANKKPESLKRKINQLLEKGTDFQLVYHKPDGRSNYYMLVEKAEPNTSTTSMDIDSGVDAQPNPSLGSASTGAEDMVQQTREQVPAPAPAERNEHGIITARSKGKGRAD